MEFLDGLQLLSGDDTISLTISPDQLDGNKKLSFSINSISHIRFYDPVTFPKTITNFLKDQLQAMIAKILKNSHSNFQSIEVYISDTNSSNRINVNFPKSKMTIWLDTFTLHDFLKLVKDFKFVFDSKEKKNFGFDSSKYHNKFPRLKTGDSKFDFIISDSNDIYYYDREYNINIYVYVLKLWGCVLYFGNYHINKSYSVIFIIEICILSTYILYDIKKNYNIYIKRGIIQNGGLITFTNGSV